MFYRTMPWGKHKHEPITDLDDGYLRWLLDPERDLSRWPGLKESLEGEMRRRFGFSGGDRSRHSSTFRPRYILPPAVGSATAAEIIAAGRRALARTYHPDLGGDADMMVAINATSDWLAERLHDLFAGG